MSCLNYKTVRTFSLIIIVYLVNVSVAPAQDAQTTLSYDQTVTGQITRDVFRQVYTFVGRADDVINILLNTTGGSLDPILLVIDDQNTLIARDDDGGKGYNAAILSLQLPRDGTYFIIVSRFGQERGSTTGSYSLTLARVGLSASASGAALGYGDNVIGEIRADAPEQIYGFTAQRGDLIHISMQRISGDLDPFLILADAQGNVLTASDDDPASPGTLDAAITDWLIRKPGTYLIVATRFGREAGTSRGGFALTLDSIPMEAMGKSIERAILIDYGGAQSGTIDDDNLLHYYQFEAHKGDVITLDAERTRGNLDPTLTLYTGDFKPITAHDQGRRGQNARISAYTVPRDGTYIVVVARFNGPKGFTAGDYTLSLIGRQGVTVGAQGTLILNYGGAVNSSIDSATPNQEYVFQGKAGDLVTIRMEATSGDLLPSVVLSDAQRRVLAQDDPNDSTAQILRFKLPASGTYVIIASRHGRVGGPSKGSYLLTLTRESS